MDIIVKKTVAAVIQFYKILHAGKLLFVIRKTLITWDLGHMATQRHEHNVNQTLTQKDLLLPHRIRATHHKCRWVERHQFKCCAGCKTDDFLLSGEGVFRATVARKTREPELKICTLITTTFLLVWASSKHSGKLRVDERREIGTNVVSR